MAFVKFVLKNLLILVLTEQGSQAPHFKTTHIRILKILKE